jgi:hypothetical protein
MAARYSKQEDAIILSTLRKVAKAGTPLNIQAALDEAGDLIYEKFGIDRSLPSLSVRWYGYLRDKHRVWGLQNKKSLPRTGDKVVPIEIMLEGKKYLLTVNLTEL